MDTNQRFFIVRAAAAFSDSNKAQFLGKNPAYRVVSWGNDANPTAGEVAALITQIFDDLFVVASKKGASFTVGDFNGDGYKDLAVAVRLAREIDRNDNSAPDFMLYVPLPPEFNPRDDRNSLGTLRYWRQRGFLVVLHGGQRAWGELSTKDKLVLLTGYSGSSVRLFSDRVQLRPATAYPNQKSPGPAPMIIHDSILLDDVFSDGRGEIIYWDGARYRYYPMDTKGSRRQ